MSKILRIAGIGSRKSPAAICNEMTKIGEWARANGHWITSGHADGADYAFEVGARENCLVYLPWDGYNSTSPLVGNACVPVITEVHKRLVTRFHPAPGKLSPEAFSLMARNGCQILGRNLDSPVDIVVCWRNAPGGTDQAIRIAESSNIPVVNMAIPLYDTAEKVIAHIAKLFPAKKEEVPASVPAIKYIKGDLLSSKCEVIAHCCNCFNTMGAGVAKAIAIKYPPRDDSR